MNQQQQSFSFTAPSGDSPNPSVLSNNTIAAVAGSTTPGPTSNASTPKSSTNKQETTGVSVVTPVVANVGVSAQSTIPPSVSGSKEGETATRNFRQLENAIEKLSLEVIEKEKDFIAQATRSNYYDHIIFCNAQKMSQIVNGVEAMKHEQLLLENMMRYAKDSQNEMESLITELENSLPTPGQLPNRYNLNQKGDQDRDRVLNAAVDLDNDMQQLTSDLMELINHANVKNKIKSADPVSRVVSVMNEHTETLQWIDEATETMKVKLEDLSRVQKDCRRQQERALRLMFATEK